MRTLVAIVLLALLTQFAVTAPARARDLNCDDFATQADAQAVYNADPSDPNDLDGDNDGVACEAYFSGSEQGASDANASDATQATDDTGDATDAGTTTLPTAGAGTANRQPGGLPATLLTLEVLLAVLGVGRFASVRPHR